MSRPEEVQAAPEALFVGRAENGRWQWSYRNAAEHIELYSNDTFVDPSEAHDAAEAAYPDVPVLLEAAEPEPPTKVFDRGPLFIRLIIGLGAAAVVVMLLRRVGRR